MKGLLNSQHTLVQNVIRKTNQPTSKNATSIFKTTCTSEREKKKSENCAHAQMGCPLSHLPACLSVCLPLCVTLE